MPVLARHVITPAKIPFGRRGPHDAADGGRNAVRLVYPAQRDRAVTWNW